MAESLLEHAAGFMQTGHAKSEREGRKSSIERRVNRRIKIREKEDRETERNTRNKGTKNRGNDENNGKHGDRKKDI